MHPRSPVHSSRHLHPDRKRYKDPVDNYGRLAMGRDVDDDVFVGFDSREYFDLSSHLDVTEQTVALRVPDRADQRFTKDFFVWKDSCLKTDSPSAITDMSW